MVMVITGHRPKKLYNIYNIYHPFYIEIGKEIRNILLTKVKALTKGEKLILVTGMALGIDTMYALIALKLKKQYPGMIELWCYPPNKHVNPKWSKSDIERYNYILSQSDRTEYCSEKYSGYTTMYKRDEAMVDILNSHTGEVISVWNGVEAGGTYHTKKYAEDKGIKVTNINPIDFFHLANKK